MDLAKTDMGIQINGSFGFGIGMTGGACVGKCPGVALHYGEFGRHPDVQLTKAAIDFQ